MTPNYLFCPNCNNQNHLPKTDKAFCHRCKASYSFQKQVAQQQVELIDKDFLPSTTMPITDRFQLIFKENTWVLKVKSKSEGERVSPLMGCAVIGLCLTLAIMLFIVLSLNPLYTLILTIILIVLLAFFYTQKNAQNRSRIIKYKQEEYYHTPSITFTYSDSFIEMEKNGSTRTIYGIEAEDLYYEYNQLKSSVKLRTADEEENEVLVELLNPSEARWLTLFLKKYLKKEDIAN